MILLQLAGTTFIVFIACFIFSIVNSGVVEDKAVQEKIDKVLDGVGVTAFISTVVLITLFLLASLWGIY